MYLVTHLAVLSFVLVNCFNFINKSDAFECLDKVHGSRQLNKQYFVTVRTKNLHDCIDECKARAKCSDINYRRAYGLCQLLEAEAYNVTHRDTISAAGYVYGNKSEWDMHRYAACNGSCAFAEACTIQNGSPTCEFKECGIPEHKNNTILLGNLYNVGSKICYECSEGFENTETGKRQCSTCMGDGNWTTVNISCTCQGWLEYNGHCYLIVSEIKNWEDAEANCNEEGAYLVNFEDEDEEAFVANKFEMGHSFWIGANDKLLHGNFVWQDGSPLVYSNWDTNEPNAPTDVPEHCVKHDWALKWHNNPCHVEYKSVCEKP